MSRISVAIIAGLFGFIAYVGVVLTLADTVLTLHWALQALFFVIAGSLWVLPARWLMYWSVGQR